MHVGNPTTQPYVVVGYHGCDRIIAEKVLSGELGLKPSKNEYDWLGHGVYFWENNPLRAWEWVNELKSRGVRGIKTPAVIGGIIDLGRCFNLQNSSNLKVVEVAYKEFKKTVDKAGIPLPENKASKTNPGGDLLLRYLDCAVINHAMSLVERSNHSFDTVRSFFVEGVPLYPNAGFHKKDHIQICVRHPEKILGYFRPA